MKRSWEEIEAFCLEKYLLDKKDKMRLTREGYYFHTAWEATDLQRQERVLLSILYALTNRGRKAIYPCWQKLAKDYGFDERHIRNMVSRLVSLEYLKKDPDGKVYIPFLYDKSTNFFWEEKVSYTKLGVFYFFLWFFRERIRRGRLCDGGKFAVALANAFGLKSPSSAKNHFYRTMAFFTENAYIQRAYSKYRRGFRLVIYRTLPFDIRRIPQKPENVSLEEYGLYVDAYFNANPDGTFKKQSLPKRKGDRDGVLTSLVKKGIIHRLYASCYSLYASYLTF